MLVFADNPYMCYDLKINSMRMNLDGVTKFDDEDSYRYIWNSNNNELFRRVPDGFNHVYQISYSRFRVQDELKKDFVL